MLRRMRLPILLLLTVSCVTLSTISLNAATEQDRFNKLRGEVLESIQSFDPVRATLAGVHSYDHRLPDYSSKAVKKQIKQLEGFDKNLGRIKADKLEASDAVDLALLQSNVKTAILELKRIETYRMSPLLYVNTAIDGLYSLVAVDSAIPQARLYAIVKRLEAVPEFFATARKNLKKPPQILVDEAEKKLEAAARFYQQAAGELMKQYPDRADEILAKSTKAREAMNDFSIYLTGLKPEDNKAASIGGEYYDQMLSDEYLLPMKSDTALFVMEEMLTQAQDDYSQYLEYVEGDHQNGKDSVFTPHSFTRQDLLDYYQWEVDQVRIFLSERDLISIPTDIAAVRVIETPPYLREVVSGTQYFPAFGIDDTPALLFIRPIPDPLDERQLAARYRYVHRRGFTGAVVHEVFPGRHLEFQQAAENDSPVRRWQRNSMMIDGWGLFCDQATYEAGIHGAEDPAVWLAILGDIRLNAALAVADIRFHTGQLSFKQALDWLAQAVGGETETEKQYLRQRLLQAVTKPASCVVPLLGKREIERIRDAALLTDEMFFSERETYDAILAQGAIPPTLLWQALDLTMPISDVSAETAE